MNNYVKVFFLLLVIGLETRTDQDRLVAMHRVNHFGLFGDAHSVTEEPDSQYIHIPYKLTDPEGTHKMVRAVLLYASEDANQAIHSREQHLWALWDALLQTTL